MTKDKERNIGIVFLDISLNEKLIPKPKALAVGLGLGQDLKKKDIGIPLFIYACVKGHLEPTHLKSSPLFTFSTKSLGQDSPSIHLFSKIIGSRFTTAKIKLGQDSPS